MRRHSILSTLLLVACAIGGLLACGRARSTEVGVGCRRVELRDHLGYVVGGGASWGRGDDLVVVDALGGRIQEVSMQGRILGETLVEAREAAERWHPTRVAQGSSALLVEITGNLFIRANGRRFETIDLWKAGNRGEFLFLIRDWVWDGEDVVVAGTVGTQEEPDRRVAVARVPLDRPDDFEVVLDVQDAAVVWEYWRLADTRYLATLDGRVAFLAMEERPRIYVETESEEGVRMKALEALPKGLTRRPELEHLDWNFPDEFIEVMEEVERATLPISMFAWKGKLYVLHRRPEGETTAWSLSRIDPAADELEATVRLPTEADHLVVAVGDREWAFLEKGEVQGLGLQRVESILFVPADRISELATEEEICASED